jgi:uracil phosphoribosyltransferase
LNVYRISNETPVGLARTNKFIKDRGIKNIKMMSILAARQGIEKLATDHPDVDFYCACIDEKLNGHGYIDPGLGDAGDRLFGTK